jgi:hypothetical protein
VEAPTIFLFERTRTAEEVSTTSLRFNLAVTGTMLPSRAQLAEKGIDRNQELEDLIQYHAWPLVNLVACWEKARWAQCVSPL